MNRLLITGASGLLGPYLVAEACRLGWSVTAWSATRRGRSAGVDLVPVDVTDFEALEAAFRAASPTAVIHAAAMAAVSACHQHPDLAQRTNSQATARLAELAAATAARFVFVSTDLVFDGEQAPYSEEALPRPLSVYGATKAAAETEVLRHPGQTVARVSLLYGPSRSDRPGFFDQQLAALSSEAELALFEDEWRTPLDLPTAATALVALAGSQCAGVVHIGGPERLSRLEMGLRLARMLGRSSASFRPARRAEAAGEPRPRDTSLDSSRWRTAFPDLPWPSLEQAVASLLTRRQ